MSNTPKLTSFFGRGENSPETQFTMEQIGANLPDKAKEQLMLQQQDEMLIQAAEVLNEAA